MNEQILDQLKDIHLPPEPSWWPLAWGYYVVFVIVAAIVVLGIFLFKIYRKRLTIKKSIARELSQIEQRFLAEGDLARLQTELSWLIRRVARLKAKSSTAAILDSKTSSVLLFGQKQEAARLVELLEKDRFKAHPEVDGHELLHIVKELML